ncbi:MAG: hypothetical protein ACYC27_14615 [Armatimonadota bacterium]
MAGGENTNDLQEVKTALAVINEKLDTTQGVMSDVKATVGKVSEFMTRQDEMNKTVKHQLWDGDGHSRIQCAEQQTKVVTEQTKSVMEQIWDKEGRSKIQCAIQTANESMGLTRLALIPIGIAITLGLISIFWK